MRSASLLPRLGLGSSHQGVHRAFALIAAALIFPCKVGADPVPGQTLEEPPPVRTEWTDYRPFVPEKMDYGLELGAMWEEQNLYWMGAQVGRHLSRCIGSASQTCQQYADVLIGVGGRDGLTIGNFLLGVRWQFVHFPRATSPFFRTFVGVSDIRDDRRDQEGLVYGVAYGWSVAVHERADLALEFRVGGGDHLWSGALVSVHLKAEQWLAYFADRLKALGSEAAGLTGSAIRGTLKTGGEVMGTVIGRPVQKATESLLPEGADADSGAKSKPAPEAKP